MKTSKILTWALLLSATTLSMTACSDDDEERTPEIVTDPLAENVAYYIVGRTMEGLALNFVLRASLVLL